MRARPKGGAVGRWARRERAAEAAELSARLVGMRGREARRGRASGGLFTPDFAGSGFARIGEPVFLCVLCDSADSVLQTLTI